METIIMNWIYFCLLAVLWNLVAINGSTDILNQDQIQLGSISPAVTEFSQHEVVYPKLLKDGQELPLIWTKKGHPERVTVKIASKEQNFTINLVRNKNLFSKSFLVKTYRDGNQFSIKKPHHRKLREHCYYHGHIQGADHSIVALSTCDGVSGYIEQNGAVYHIEPARDLDKTSHRFYKDVHKSHKPMACGAHPDGHSLYLNDTLNIQLTSTVLKRRKRSLQEPYDSNINTRYVEMYIVNDVKTFVSNRQNEAYQVQKTQNIVNILSRLYRPFNVYVALVGIENWTTDNQCDITLEADTTLDNFLRYRRSRINPHHRNDNAQLITGTTFRNGVVGKAIKGTICTFQYSGGVNLNLKTEGQTATTIAHELGHNFGMDHDNYTVCQCHDDKCIMAATSGGVNTPTKWSSCSMLALQEAFEMGMDYCLRNVPDQLESGPVCGNSFTEEGEECDCGMPEDCQNRCCNASTCKLVAGAQCAVGRCCDFNTCKVKEAATMCRATIGECDLPEFCNGSSPACPTDVYVQEGTDCYDGQSYCLNGTCKSHTGQCKLLWGSTGRQSDPVCYRHLNLNGSKYGNCGYNWTTNRYEPCLRGDVMCGMLHCVHQNEKLMFWKDNLAHATPATFLKVGTTTYVCRGAMLDVGLDMPDPGVVPDGAKCGDRQMCYNRHCMSVASFNFPSCPEGCSDRGVCNSKGHCHCNEGWGPPTCEVAGNGGSVDSGPVKIEGDKSLLIGLLVFFLVIVPLLGLLIFALYYFRHSILAWWHQQYNKKPKGQSRPLRPAHPPPKRDAHNLPDESPPSYNNVVNAHKKPIVVKRPQPSAPPLKKTENERPKLNTKISNPVLTGSTHNEALTHVQRSPGPDRREHVPRPPPPPKLPTKATKAPLGNQGASKPLIKNSERLTSSDSKPKFGPIFKIPSFSKADTKPSSPKPEKKEEPPVANIVKKRELTRDISNPVLISTTDRRSKHLVKNDSFTINQNDVLTPPVPPHVSLNRSESDVARRNRPLPPRPMSMPESECGDDLPMDSSEARKSFVVGGSSSPRMPVRPPPPPLKPHLDNTRRTIEDELAKLDSIDITVPEHHDSDSGAKSSPKPAHPKTKDIKPRPKAPIKKSSSDSARPNPPAKGKSAGAKLKSSDSSLNKPKVKPTPRTTFNPKSRPGLATATKQSAIDKNSSDSKLLRKASSDSLEGEGNEGAASVSGLAKMFEGQKKPLLSERSDAQRTQSHGSPKVPMTPPKPRAKHIRSIDV